MKTIPLGTLQVPRLGQGTWNLGDEPARRALEIATLRRGIELGMSLIDTAEMYGDGHSERLVGEAIQGLRDQVYLVSKILPSNASRLGTPRACEASLRRLGTDHIDLYLLHWRGRFPLAETVDALETLVAQGKIGAWGVSNFDLDDMEELAAVGATTPCAVNQVLYNPEHRGIEFDLIDGCRSRQIALMAYSPLGQAGDLFRSRTLAAVARRYGCTLAQVALAWSLRLGMLAIPKASSIAHVEENARAESLLLDPDDCAVIDIEFPAPKWKLALEML
jgi:diketogulonate reductase-like aldo/keto reductase